MKIDKPTKNLTLETTLVMRQQKEGMNRQKAFVLIAMIWLFFNADQSIPILCKFSNDTGFFYPCIP